MILFTSQRPLERAENIKAVYDAYDGAKRFERLNMYRQIPDLHSGKYELQVTDELPSDTVGKCLFISHGMGGNKTYGLQQPHPYFNRPDLITAAIATSKDTMPVVAKYCGISESQVVITGLPRTDAYFNKPQKESGKRNYLYVPTFRSWFNWWAPEWSSLDELLNDDEEFIVKPHMVTKRLLPEKPRKHIFEADSMKPSTEFLLRADVVITDYSSIMFDAFVMRTPVVLFAKDRHKYLRERGMYLEYPDKYSDYFCHREDYMVQMIRYAEWTPHMEELRDYYAGACNGRSTERVIELIKSML